VLRDVVHGRLVALLAREVADHAIDTQREVLQVTRDPERPRAVAEVALDLARDRRDGVAGKRDPPSRIEPVDRLDKREARHLKEIVAGLLGSLVARRDLAREGQEALDDRVAVDVTPGVPVALEQRAVVFRATGNGGGHRRDGRAA
jgi:hypothetical protein